MSLFLFVFLGRNFLEILEILKSRVKRLKVNIKVGIIGLLCIGEGLWVFYRVIWSFCKVIGGSLLLVFLFVL